MTRVLCLVDRPLGARCLEYLYDAFRARICGVVSRPDGEELWWGVSGFASDCRGRGLAWFDHARPLADIVCATRPDIIVSVLYTKLVPKDITQLITCVNLHCAPLPAYRGFNSTLWAILNGEPEFGVTLHVMDEHADSGNVVDRATFAVPDDVTNVELYGLAHAAGYDLFVRTFPHLLAGDYRAAAQTGTARYYAKDEIPSREVDLSWPAEKVARIARAFWFPPFEPAYFVVDGVRVNLVPGAWREREASRAADMMKRGQGSR